MKSYHQLVMLKIRCVSLRCERKLQCHSMHITRISKISGTRKGMMHIQCCSALSRISSLSLAIGEMNNGVAQRSSARLNFLATMPSIHTRIVLSSNHGEEVSMGALLVHREAKTLTSRSSRSSLCSSLGRVVATLLRAAYYGVEAVEKPSSGIKLRK